MIQDGTEGVRRGGRGYFGIIQILVFDTRYRHSGVIQRGPGGVRGGQGSEGVTRYWYSGSKLWYLALGIVLLFFCFIMSIMNVDDIVLISFNLLYYTTI